MADANGRVVMRLSDPDGEGQKALRLVLAAHDALRCLASLAACCSGSHEPGSVAAIEAVKEAERVLGAVGK